MPAAPPSLTLARERIARHGFTDRPARTVAAAAAHTVGLQAQDAPAARLGVRSRSATLTDADVLTALEVDRTVVRTSLMRATIHLVDTADVRWLTALFGPSIRQRFAKRWRDLGLTTGLLDRATAALPAILAGGPRNRAEILAAWRERGIDLPNAHPLTESPTHTLRYATSLGVVCRGPDRGREPTFALLDSWVPDAPAGLRGDEALAELTRRWFAAYSPATAADFTAWSGLPSGDAVSLIRDELTPGDVAGRPGYTLGDVEPRPAVRLLSAFDNYLVGYQDRDPIIDAEHRRAVYAGGVIRPTVLVDGRVVGTWRVVRGRGRTGRLEVRMFGAARRRDLADIEGEVDDIGRFLRLALRPEVHRSGDTPGDHPRVEHLR